ncbi:MAG TPA: GDSL-type esterase/lipase family protein, partial [Ktedonobacteraceae bacterium]
MHADTRKQQDVQSLPLASDSGSNWRGAWYAAPMQMQPAHFTGRTLSQIVHLHAGGRQIRLRFSNRYGEHPLVLTSISVGRSIFDLVQERPSQPVLFQGKEHISIEAGRDIVSDPIHLQVEAFSNLVISFIVAEGDISTGHLIASQTSYVSTLGARSASTITAVEELLPSYPLMTTAWWAVTGVDVLPGKPINVVVTLGDSTTDGAFSTIDANRRYPDYLARQLAAAGEAGFMSVLNAGISWNELLTTRFPAAGEMTLHRLAWDVLEQVAVTDVIVQIGINDLRNDAQATTIVDGLQQLATLLRERRRRIFGSTILPGSYTPEQVAQWRIVNTWLREQGTQWFDAIFDFAAALCHPEDETRLDPRCNSGDDIHPNDTGYQRMAETIDIT